MVISNRHVCRTSTNYINGKKESMILIKSETHNKEAKLLQAHSYLWHFCTDSNQRLLGVSSWMNWIVNEHRCKVPVLLNFVIKFRYCWQPNVEDYHLCIYSNSGRLEKHSVLKFICFKLLGHCNIFTFLLSFFFLYFMTFSVCWLLDRSCLHSLAFGFWHLLFGIQCRF